MTQNYIFIVGTRAQLIKVAPTIRVFEQHQMPTKFILTGQHKDTMDDLIQEFGITTQPIELIKDKEHSSIIALLLWIPSIIFLLLHTLRQNKKSYVFVHGDTLTTLFSTITAKLSGHLVVHLESGLTSKNLFNPFPEEIIRRIVFKYTDIACCPNPKDVQNMERYPKIRTLYTHGNTILDSIQYLKIGRNIEKRGNTILISLHRFQNIYNKERLHLIVNMLIKLSNEYKIFFVLHPATQKKLNMYQLTILLDSNKNIKLLPRMTYQKFLNLALTTDLVITDGGSNQEELAFFGHPTIILRETTERQDGLGKNAILLNDTKCILEYIRSRKYLSLKKNSQTLEISPSLIITEYFKNRKKSNGR
ncbi:UDP-N-acetylglucosamine 2-epimerase [Acinetobacter sp. VNH17]|uniref:UDP-N-acetylglucosamine 2-epimerase n=1 Tax=Acinetobacter thutiue TaxID=2998078 RepID=A0ABT7WPL4_9GAMM|nr:UDP-N-acetylglucosamine 2-epimerase [Acinetobacter thutiue]MCY6412405.1 UDP-N-acetylglucosamine 2-epimerase [Acinetobacter thutiue]MDN0014509.1 UDP-N-acetylglucosamine 2-epimerase [Acinetobacter thutiue]